MRLADVAHLPGSSLKRACFWHPSLLATGCKISDIAAVTYVDRLPALHLHVQQNAHYNVLPRLHNHCLHHCHVPPGCLLRIFCITKHS